MPELEDLKLSEDRAVAIIEKGIEYEAYGDEQDETPEVPKSKKERLEAADEIIALCVDAYVNDGITPDDEDPDVAEEGRRIEEIIGLAGIEIDDDGNIVYGDMPELDGDDNEDDDEAPFNPDDYIEGYSELSAVSKLKAVKKLDVDSDDDAAILEAIADWENDQDKPSSRVLHYVDETLGPEEDEPEPDEPDEDEDADDADEPEAEEDEDDQPWEGYDKATAAQIKKVLADQKDDEDEPLTREQVEYVLEYEEGRDKPRKRVVDYCNALISEFDNGGDDEPEEEPESEPEKPKRGRGRGRGRKAEQSEPKPAAPPESSNGSITLTRDQILTALTDGEVTIEL